LDLRGIKRQEFELHDEKLYNLYSLLSIVRMITLEQIRWVGHVSCWERYKVHRCVGKHEDRRPLGWSVQGDAVCPKKRWLVGWWLFYDAFSVIILYSADDRVIRE
jgi:hypothetical protein